MWPMRKPGCGAKDLCCRHCRKCLHLSGGVMGPAWKCSIHGLEYWPDLAEDDPPPRSFQLSAKRGGPGFRIAVRSVFHGWFANGVAHAGDIEVIRCQDGRELQSLPVMAWQPINFGAAFMRRISTSTAQQHLPAKRSAARRRPPRYLRIPEGVRDGGSTRR
jgi:hypothetical protein